MTPVHVAVFDSYADWELGHVTAHLRKPSWQVDPGRYEIVTVGPTTDPVTSMGGLKVLPDLAVTDLTPTGSAMLVLPGGEHWADDAMAPFRSAARAFLAAGVPVAAICGATYGLALEGLLDDRAHTSNAAEYLAASGYAGGPRFVAEPAVVDGDLITASGTTPVHFARAVFDRLGSYAPSTSASWFKLYGDNDPAGFFELMAV